MNKSEIFSRAWELARQGAAEFGGSARDYFSQSLQIVYNQIKIIVPPSRLPVWSYKGMIKPNMYFLADHAGSGTFYNINRGVGRCQWDGLDPAGYLGTWEDGTDYTVDDVMEGANTAPGALPQGAEYAGEIGRVVWSAEYMEYIRNGGDPKDVV